MQKAIILILIILIPFKVLACPHYDEDGNIFFLYNHPDDYEITIIEYPKDIYHHYYHYDPDFELLAEYIEIILYQETKYPDIFAFDYDYDEEPISPYFLEDDLFLIDTEFFSLRIPLVLTKENSLDKIAHDTQIMSYFYKIDLVNEAINNNVYQKLQGYLQDLPIKPLEYDIFQINVEERIGNNVWEHESLTIKDFHEAITVRYEIGEDVADNLAVVKIDSFDRPIITVSEIEFSIDEDHIVFVADNAGFYKIVEKEADFAMLEIENKDYVVDDANEKANPFIIILSVLGVLLLVGSLVFISRKQITIK